MVLEVRLCTVKGKLAAYIYRITLIITSLYTVLTGKEDKGTKLTSQP